MGECKINIIFLLFKISSVSIYSILFWHTQIKPIQGIMTWLSLAPNVSNWSKWKAFFGHILHINMSVFRLKSIAILGDCFLMAPHYRNVGHGSNENVITASAEAVQGGVLSSTNILSHLNLLACEMMNHWEAACTLDIEPVSAFVTMLHTSYGVTHNP